MIVDRRRVDRLSLRVREAADASTAANTIQQALRIATMPGDGRPGRLFIRRIDLGTIRLGDGPNRIARSLETQLRAVRVGAIAISDPRAPTADVVIARDPIEPLVVALAHAAARRPLTAWYWPHVHAKLGPRLSPAEIATIVWTLLAERSDAAACVPAVVGAVLDRDRAVDVLAPIDPILGERLARILEVTPIAAVAAEAIEPRWRPAVREMMATWAGDVRAAWLVTAAVKAANPRISAARLAGLLRGVTGRPVRDPVADRPPRETPSASDRPPVKLDDETLAVGSNEPIGEPRPSSPSVIDALSRTRPQTPDVADETPTKPDHVESPSTPAGRSAPSSAEATPEESERSPEVPPTTPTRWTLLERPQPTRHGGLYFLLRPLARLKLEAFVAAHPELETADFGIRVLSRIADALGIAWDDPIRVALELPPLESPINEPLHDLIETWHAAVSAWLDRHAELDLSTVVHRNAAVLCSRTHLDVIFDMESSDVRLRKAALDIDPGWVPWLGRVVSFHYVHGGMLDG